MTVQKQFEEYLSEYLNLKDGDIKKIQIHKELREQLQKNLQFKGDEKDEEIYSFLTGSYVRGTAIRPPKDVDFFIVLNEQKYGTLSPGEILELLRKTLQDIAPDKTVFRQSHSATIEYEEEFSIDVIPAFEINAKLYRIPEVSDSNELWLESNPKIHQERLTEANELANGNLVPIIKLLKSWKRDKCDFIKSFHLETLAIKILSNSTIVKCADGLELFFSNAENYLNSPCLKDPANDQNCVDSYLTDEERKKIKEIISTEKALAQAAVLFEKAGEVDAAIAEWDEIFNFNPERKKFINKNPQHEKQLPYTDNLQYKIKISARLFNVKKGKYVENYYSNSRKLPKGWKLSFCVDTSHIPGLKEIYWQVVNQGKEAELVHDLRGELMPDKGENEREEHTKYSGTHYINCFVVQNRQCIAKDRFFVKII